MSRLSRTVLLVAVALAGWSAAAAACPVCYGAADSAVLDGARWAVVFLGVLVYAVMGGGVALVVTARRRSGRGRPDTGSTGTGPLGGGR